MKVSAGLRPIYWCLAGTCLVALVSAWPNGAPCSTEHNMTPSPTRHGTGQAWDENVNPPPFFFQFADSSGQVSRTYKENEVYTLRIVGQKPFKGFLVQARYVNGIGKITENNPVGYFIKQEEWLDEGVRHQGCSVGQTSVTHQDALEKNEVILKWKAPASTHALQFLISVVESQSYFWVKWTPKSGFVTPSGFYGVTQLPDPSSRMWAGDNIVESFGKDSERLPPVQTVVVDGYGRETVTNDKTRTAQAFPQVGTIGHAGTIGKFPFSNVPLNPSVGAELGLIDQGSCSSSPCLNGGVCKPGIGKKITGYTCQCAFGWDGANCEVTNKCNPNPCRNGACVSTPYTYECKCWHGYGGSTCHLPCPSTQCSNGGTCQVNDYYEYTCICPKGWTGPNCLTEENECYPNPCLNGAVCHDQFNGFSCQCRSGFVGYKCQRPCVDIYGQCEGWANEHQKCILRPLTKFFDENCPVSCKVCYPDNRIEMDGPPTIPDLDVLDWLVGEWTTAGHDNQYFPLPFDMPAGTNDGYKEKMTFAVSVVPAFGAPYLNYSTIARSDYNYYDVQQASGFLIVEPRTKPNLKCVLKSINNNGIMIMEDASIPKDGKKELVFKSSEIVKLPSLVNALPVKTRRTFKLKPAGNFLEVETYMYFQDGHSQKFLRYFTKEKGYEFYRVRKTFS